MPTFDLPIWLIVSWLFVVGGAVGSFLNVVVYRLPNGMSLIHPPSHCPKCGKPIAWFDNVPVFGWIMLRGRCRQCHNPISARYPLVEAITAAMFGLLAIVEIEQLTTLYPIHLLLLCTLLCAGLIEHDGNRPPWRLFFPALIVGVAAMWFFPAGLPTLAEWRRMTPSQYVIIDVLANLGVLAFVGTMLRASRRQDPTGLVPGVLCVAAVLGWPGGAAVIAIATMLTLLSWIFRRVLPRVRVPLSVSLGAVTLVWILAWAGLVCF